MEQSSAGRARSPLSATVVIPTFRGARRLPALLDALEAQAPRATFDIIVVVDGPDEATQALLRSYLPRLPLTVLVNDRTSGVGATLARGFGAATGDILIRCDDDITPPPDFVQGHIAWHTPGSDLGVISATVDVFYGSAYALAYGRPANLRGLDDIYARPPHRRWMAWAACNSVRRATYERVGGFDRTVLYSEDMDLGFRLWRDGVSIVVDPDLQVVHRGPARTASARVPRAFVSGMARRAMIDRYPDDETFPTEQDPARTPWQLATRLVSGLVRSQQAAGRVGRTIDRLGPRLPTSLHGRLIALAVEGAGAAGALHGDPTRSRWDKAGELEREGHQQ